MASIYPHQVKTIDGKIIGMDSFHDHVLLIVNTASRCGFTPQYQGLEELYQTYKDQGLVVLGFPCNQFGHQEPADNIEIAVFCQRNYSVSFPLFEKIEVNGPNAHPLFQQLKTAAPGFLGSVSIKWNFSKFLIDHQGNVFKRYGPLIPPSAIATDIEHLLQLRR